MLYELQDLGAAGDDRFRKCWIQTEVSASITPERRRVGYVGERWFGPTKPGQPSRAPTLDQGAESFANERSLIGRTGEALRFREQVVVQDESRPFSPWAVALSIRLIAVGISAYRDS